VEVHEVFTQALQQGKSDRRVIDELAVRRLPDDPADDELGVVARIQAAVCEDGIDFRRILELEDRLDRTGFFPRPNQRFLSPLAEHQFQGSDDNGFSGPGLAGDADQSGAEFPSEFIHEGEIADFEESEHALTGVDYARRAAGSNRGVRSIFEVLDRRDKISPVKT
jgi:hypothetical protein